MSIAIGTAQFGLNYGISNLLGRTSFNEAKRIIEYAKLSKINFIDTAREYGNSEEVIGKIISNNNQNYFNIITKVSKSSDIESDINKSLEMLSMHSVYGVLIHNTNMLFGPEGKSIYRDLVDKKQKGLVKKVGVSVYTPKETKKILENFDIDIIQIPSSILDQRFVNSGTIEMLKEKNIEIHVRSIFLQGLYFMSPNIPDCFSSIKEKLMQVDEAAQHFNISKVKLIIEYAKSLDVDKIVVGVNNLNQLIEIHKEYNSEKIDINFNSFSLDNKLVDPRFWE